MLLRLSRSSLLILLKLEPVQLLLVLQINLESLQKHAAEKLAPYQIPKLLKILDEMPRNAMGKMNKIALVKDVFPHEA